MDKYYQAMIRDILAEKLYDANTKITRLEENEALLLDQLKAAGANQVIMESELRMAVLKGENGCQCGGKCSEGDYMAPGLDLI